MLPVGGLSCSAPGGLEGGPWWQRCGEVDAASDSRDRGLGWAPLECHLGVLGDGLNSRWVGGEDGDIGCLVLVEVELGDAGGSGEGAEVRVEAGCRESQVSCGVVDLEPRAKMVR
jgi:hypothetical protein